ncbi:MAG: DUF3179 domain-containing protein [Calditrichaeota bacterium]|nr:MAG: DUF3179 domain-containing protein [Calditrichota bacterium]
MRKSGYVMLWGTGLLLGAMMLLTCTNPLDGPRAEVERQNGRVFIVDNTGKRWDVTHAEQKYGMKAEDFQFGLGPFAIPPIRNPRFISPGDDEYPFPDQTFLVIGFALNGEARAYPISVLTRHEIVDERFDSTFVAVAY